MNGSEPNNLHNLLAFQVSGASVKLGWIALYRRGYIQRDNSGRVPPDYLRIHSAVRS